MRNAQTGLVLSTIHSAKGLEWGQVYLLGVHDGGLPSSRALDDPEQLAEEQRLLYVAVTRAKTALCLTWHHGLDRPGGHIARLSRFLAHPRVRRCLAVPVPAPRPVMTGTAGTGAGTGTGSGACPHPNALDREALLDLLLSLPKKQGA